MSQGSITGSGAREPLAGLGLAPEQASTTGGLLSLGPGGGHADSARDVVPRSWHGAMGVVATNLLLLCVGLPLLIAILAKVAGAKSAMCTRLYRSLHSSFLDQTEMQRLMSPQPDVHFDAGVDGGVGVAATVASGFHRASDFTASLQHDLEGTLLWNIADTTLLSLGHSCQVGRSQGRQGR